MKKLLFSLVAFALVMALSASVVVAGSSTNLVKNGDFETGDLTYWSVFHTINGTINGSDYVGGLPVVEAFDTNGDSTANLSAKVQVGQVLPYVPGVWEGGGIYQEVSASAGPWTASADIAAYNPSSGTNTQGGLFELFIDGALEDSYNVGSMLGYATNRSTLSASGTFITAGSYEIRIKITRPYRAIGTPRQYVDNVVLEVTTTSVDIDIKPGSDPNSINLKSKGIIPVAILTTDVFDATEVDPTTVLFAGAAPIRWAVEDVDYDGDLDLVLHFKTQETGIAAGDAEATLTGELFDGTPIEGIDSVRVKG